MIMSSIMVTAKIKEGHFFKMRKALALIVCKITTFILRKQLSILLQTSFIIDYKVTNE